MPLSNAGKNAIQAYGMKRFKSNLPPATSTQEATSPPFYQSQSRAGTDTPGGSAPQTGIRARLLQTINPEPVRDEQEEGRIRELAKVNALGTALGSLGQLAGVASGGDAVRIENQTNPWIMSRMAYLDDDYRNQVRDFTSRAFAMDRFNIDQQNQDIQDANTNEWQKEQIRLRGEEARQTAEMQAKLRLQEFDQKTEAEKAEEMRRIGIDPRDPKAFDKYIERTNQQFGVNTNYRKSLTAENYANASRQDRAPASPGQEFDLSTMKKGVQNIVSDLQKQREGIKNLPFSEQAEAKKKIDEEITFWERQYNPKTNELLNERVLDAANRSGQSQQGSGSFGTPYQPGQGFQFGAPAQTQTQPQRSDDEIMQAMNANRKFVLENAKRIASINLEDPDPETANLILEKAQELIDLGIVQDEEEAIDIIINLAKSNAK